MKRTDVCANCGRKLSTINQSNVWIHDDTKTVLCHPELRALPKSLCTLTLRDGSTVSAAR